MILSTPILHDRKSLELGNATPLRLQFSEDGGILAQRYGSLLINQVVSDPWAEGLFRLAVREIADGRVIGHCEVAGAGIEMAREANGIVWRAEAGDGLAVLSSVEVHHELPAWMWSVTISNVSKRERTVDVLMAQDIGIGDESAVSNNEAYNSQYIDMNPLRDPKLGWVVLARQNQPTALGSHPVLAVACMDGARAYCTDGRQFFGSAHCLTGMTEALRTPELPSCRMQQECALAALQSRVISLASGSSGTVSFVLRLVPDHPSATGPADLEIMRGLADWHRSCAAPSSGYSVAKKSIFIDTSIIAGDEPGEEDWAAWFPGVRRHEEHAENGALLSFFHGDETHVVSRRKEADVWRPHGHILRSGFTANPDPDHFGLTCYASGIFAVQVYLGNPSLCELLPVVRDHLGILRANGQRVFVCLEKRWCQLGVPSAFAMTPGSAHWFYKFGKTVIELSARCFADVPAAALNVRVVEGGPLEFLVTHRLCPGSGKNAENARVDFDSGCGTATVVSATDGLDFALCVSDAKVLARIGGDELVHDCAKSCEAGYVAMRTHATTHFQVLMTGTVKGDAALAERLAIARKELESTKNCAASCPCWHGPRLYCQNEPAVECVNEIMPWSNHDAWIHFSAPHGLEQSGGGAWGVRDVCQGSMEWLLATGRFDAARAVLIDIFSRQYAREGGWPQWFMLPPFQNIRQKDSHGDIPLWPVNALCRYIERTNDASFLSLCLPYADDDTFLPTTHTATVLEHCDRVVAGLRERMLPQTSLINYGNGDWDDTLQPVDPSLRTKMVSAWTVGLACQTLSLLADVCSRFGEELRARELTGLVERMRTDFRSHLMADGVIAGFLIRDGTRDTLLLHPSDKATGIRYRLIPMTRAILAGILEPDEARVHLDIIAHYLRFADGVRLMSDPVSYRGGEQRFFKRAETAANVGREIGLMYVHAHLRYAEALAYFGDGEALWHALRLVNPVDLKQLLPQAQARQSNVFFSSSDAGFNDRYEAARRWDELRAGKVPVRGGWRLYSSGPGLFINLVRSSLLGIRESFGDVLFDPVLPRSMNGLSLRTELSGRNVTVKYSVGDRSSGVRRIGLNGTALEGLERVANPYRQGGLRVPVDLLSSLLTENDNTITIEL
jgi:1,2-beta-oligoglucan phosphorylase